MIEDLIQCFQAPVQFLRGVGPYLSSLLENLRIRTLEDLLYHIPERYLDQRFISRIGSLEIDAHQMFQGELIQFEEVLLGRTSRKIFQAIFSDGSGFITAKWFHYRLGWMKKAFKKGKKALLSGRIEAYRGEKQIIHPEIEWLEEKTSEEEQRRKILPFYPLTEGLTQKQLYRCAQAALAKSQRYLFEFFPRSFLEDQQLISYPEALQKVHSPPLEENLELYQQKQSPAHHRLIFDEFFFLELSLALKKRGRFKEEGIQIPSQDQLLERFYAYLPFELTSSQKKVIQEIQEDLAQSSPMNRLLQGDVGSGKTVVAAASALLAMSAGYQVCLMAPTEILAEQHAKNFERFFEPFSFEIRLLKSDLGEKEKRFRLKQIATGKTPFVVGTHALLQDPVQFHNLAFVIIDEQHRFGVIQRSDLKKKGESPHLLIMTATPIPRTLSMTVYGELETSILRELPQGRRPIFTRLVLETERPKMYEFIRKETGKGRQVYFVYPLIEKSEKLDLKNAIEMFEKLRTETFPDRALGLLHGQMRGEEKENVIEQFRLGQIQILISTTVIEVGVDVPNATIMVVEHAERFGLSQLHQIRGRVGRGAEKSYCFLMSGRAKSEKSSARLRVLSETQDGFKIAEADLQLRGPGDFLGTRQSGLADFRIANLIRDSSILEKARKAAFEWIEKDPSLSSPESEPIKKILFHRFKHRLNLAQVG